jgi:ribosomal-protein-alanine N-acetyltransferase
MRQRDVGGRHIAGEYGACVLELQLLRSDHAQAILAFELEKRTYFAASITDRGDEFYERFSERHHALLAEQGRGVATTSLRELCRLARDQYDLRTLTAGTTAANRASRRVLEKAGFVSAGGCTVGCKPGVRYMLDLALTAEG